MEYNTPKKCKLTKIIDGDTFDCETIPEGNVYRIRMNSIDAPEMNQPAGWESKYALHKMMEDTDFEFYLVPKGVGKNKRIIGDIYSNEASALNERVTDSYNYKLCEEGQAWYYKLDGNGSNLIRSAQEVGRSNNRGLWNRRTSEPIHPAQWRKENSKMSFYGKSLEELRKVAFAKSHHISLKDIKNSYPSMSKKQAKNQKAERSEKKRVSDNNFNSMAKKEEVNPSIDALEKLADFRSTPESRRKKDEHEEQENNKENTRLKEQNSYIQSGDIAPNANAIREANLESLMARLVSGETDDKIKEAAEKMNSNLEKTFKSEQEIREEKSRVDEALETPESQEKIRKFIEERNKRLSTIKPAQVSASNKRTNQQENLSKENLSKLKTSAVESVDSIFDIGDLDLDGLNFDEVSPNDNLVSVSNERNEVEVSDNGYNPEEMDYSSNDQGFQNKVAPESVPERDFGIPASIDEILEQDNGMPDFGNDFPPIESYDGNYDMSDNGNYDDFEIPDLNELDFTESLDKTQPDPDPKPDSEVKTKKRQTNRPRLGNP